MRKELTNSINVLLEMGIDCNIYWRFRTLMEQIDLQATEGDKSAQEIVNRVHGVANLINYAQKEEK